MSETRHPCSCYGVWASRICHHLSQVIVLPGARIASIVVGRPELFKEWNEEMEYMSGRIKVPALLDWNILPAETADPGPL